MWDAVAGEPSQSAPTSRSVIWPPPSVSIPTGMGVPAPPQLPYSTINDSFASNGIGSLVNCSSESAVT